MTEVAPFPPGALEALRLSHRMQMPSAVAKPNRLSAVREFFKSNQSTFAIYGFKGITYGFIVCSIFLARKIFSDTYMQKVYVDKTDPPSLLWMLLTFGLLMLGFLFFLGTLIYLLHLTFMNVSLFEPRLMWRAYQDSGVFFAFFLTFSVLIAAIVQKKKYFRYKTEGLRAIRAYGEMMMYIAAILLLVPFFMMMSRSQG